MGNLYVNIGVERHDFGWVKELKREKLIFKKNFAYENIMNFSILFHSERYSNYS